MQNIAKQNLIRSSLGFQNRYYRTADRKNENANAGIGDRTDESR
jgi:hypothetical protein